MITKKITNILISLSLKQIEDAFRMTGEPGIVLQTLLVSPEWKATMVKNVKETLKKLVRAFAKAEEPK